MITEYIVFSWKDPIIILINCWNFIDVIFANVSITFYSLYHKFTIWYVSDFLPYWWPRVFIFHFICFISWFLVCLIFPTLFSTPIFIPISIHVYVHFYSSHLKTVEVCISSVTSKNLPKTMLRLRYAHFHGVLTVRRYATLPVITLHY